MKIVISCCKSYTRGYSESSNLTSLAFVLNSLKVTDGKTLYVTIFIFDLDDLPTTAAIFDHICNHRVSEYEWFIRAPDDVYIRGDALRDFLAGYDPDEMVGYTIKVIRVSKANLSWPAP